ncbi:hypothetical protein RND81_13G092000 [Saponaria officinalis]|uniref:GAG-pre-integrase domain-containing protein n=1 Tax=Saponaria officinalis TaxID=3572 RepID=A0AAW1GVP2_SAPOF
MTSGDQSTYNSVYKDPLHLTSGDQSLLHLVPQVFSGKSFLRWSRTIKIALIAKNKFGFVDGTYAKPADSHATYNDWIRTDYTIMRWILNSLSDTIADSLSYVTSSKHLWDELEERFNQSNAPYLYQLRKDVIQIVQNDSSVAKYYSRLKSVWEDVRALDPLPACSCGVVSKCSCALLKKIADRENKNNLIDFLMGLHPKYEALRGQILAMEPLPSVNRAFAKVHQAEVQKHISAGSSVDLDGMAMVAYQFSTGFSDISQVSSWKKGVKKPKPDRASYFCDHCHKSGHTKEFCWKLKNQRYKSSGHGGNYRGNGPPGKRFAGNVEEVPGFEGDTPFDEVSPTSNITNAVLPPSLDNSFVQAVARELLKLQTTSSTAHGQSFTGMAMTSLANTRASDHMTYDFTNFKTHRLLLKPLTVSLPDGQTKLVDCCGEVQLTAILDPSTKELTTTPTLSSVSASCSSSLMSVVSSLSDVCLMHARLGHTSLGTMKHVLHAVNFQNKTSVMHCETCLLAKHHKVPFPIIHVNLWGPYRVKSLNGSSYFLTILDDFSRTMVYGTLKHFLAYVRNHFQTTVKTLRSDTGTEIVQHECGKLLSDNGIQNGKVERKHRL